MAGIAPQPSSVVRAVFKDASCSFNLRGQATLGDLAEELDYMGQRFGGSPLYVDVLVRSGHGSDVGSARE
jgi:hypothetical protein